MPEEAERRSSAITTRVLCVLWPNSSFASPEPRYTQPDGCILQVAWYE